MVGNDAGGADALEGSPFLPYYGGCGDGLCWLRSSHEAVRKEKGYEHGTSRHRQLTFLGE